MKKVVLVSGGSRGIGAGISKKFAQLGYNVVINYSKSDEAAKETAEEVESHGVESLLVKANLSEKNDCKLLVDETIKKFGQIDVLVNNAGVDGKSLPIWDYPDDEFDYVMKLNTYAPFYIIKHASKYMKDNKNGGSIVNISTMLTDIGSPGMSGYMASKSAINGLTKTVALDLAQFNINVNTIAPGVIETDMVKSLPKEVFEMLKNTSAFKRFGQAADVAALTTFLASEDARYITAQYIKVDGYTKL